MRAFLTPSTLTIHVQAIQAAHVAKEWVNQAFHDQKEEESKHFIVQKSLVLTNKKLKETLHKLAKYDKARKSTKSFIESFEKQAQEQLVHLREVESQLAIARTTISKLKKELGQKDEQMNKVEQAAYDQGQKDTKAHLKS